MSQLHQDIDVLLYLHINPSLVNGKTSARIKTRQAISSDAGYFEENLSEGEES